MEKYSKYESKISLKLPMRVLAKTAYVYIPTHTHLVYIYSHQLK